MLLVRYQGRVAGFLGATRYALTPELDHRDPADVNRRRVRAVCEFALDLRAMTGFEIGRLPEDGRDGWDGRGV